MFLRTHDDLTLEMVTDEERGYWVDEAADRTPKALPGLRPTNTKVLPFARRFGDERIRVVANLSRFVQFAELEPREVAEVVPEDVFGHTAEDRRVERSPLRDVACMIRSFDYAVQVTLLGLSDHRGCLKLESESIHYASTIE